MSALEPEVLQLPPLDAAPLPRDPSSGRLYVVTDDYGTRGGAHEGIDLATRDASGKPTTGIPVHAVWPAVVVEVEQSPRAGLYVKLEHADEHHAFYAHLSRADVEPGDIVMPGDVIGLSGASGKVNGPHLHLELRPFGGDGIDPEPYLRELERTQDEGGDALVPVVSFAIGGSLLAWLFSWLRGRRKR